MQFGVAKAGQAARPQPETDGGDDEAPGIALVEAAGAIAESAIAGGELDPVFTLSIPGAHGLNHFGDFLAIRADVLYGRGADGSGNTAEALDAGPTASGAPGNKSVLTW